MDFRKERLNRRNSLHFSLRPGNSGRLETVNLPAAAVKEAELGMLKTHASRCDSICLCVTPETG
jgi:hypothetical protein